MNKREQSLIHTYGNLNGEGITLAHAWTQLAEVIVKEEQNKEDYP